MNRNDITIGDTVDRKRSGVPASQKKRSTFPLATVSFFVGRTIFGPSGRRRNFTKRGFNPWDRETKRVATNCVALMAPIIHRYRRDRGFANDTAPRRLRERGLSCSPSLSFTGVTSVIALPEQKLCSASLLLQFLRLSFTTETVELK